VRRLVGYGRFDGVETAKVLARLYAAARLYVNFFQPSFKLKEKRREGAKIIKRYHAPITPYERAVEHPKLDRAVKQRLRMQYRTLDPIALLAEIRAAQEELGHRIERGGRVGTTPPMQPTQPDAETFARALGAQSAKAVEPRATHRRTKRRYKTRVRMPSKLDRYLSLIESWFATEPQLTALTIVGRLAERDPEHFGPKQHSIVQRLLKKLRMKAAQQLHATPAGPGRGRGQIEETTAPSGPVDGSGLIAGPDPPTGP
jgi:hypothetical protein